MLYGNNGSDRSRPALGSILSGAALGLLLEIAALIASIASAGAGHGDYVAARALFPASMLLTLVEGKIGMLSMAVALLQFPIYGGLLGWARVREIWLPVMVAGSLHLVAAIACFSGTLPNFS
jgi:hypothetical protein